MTIGMTSWFCGCHSARPTAASGCRPLGPPGQSPSVWFRHTWGLVPFVTIPGRCRCRLLALMLDKAMAPAAWASRRGHGKHLVGGSGGGEWPTVDGAFARRAGEEAVTQLSSETIVRLLSSPQNRHRFSASHKRNLGKVGHSSRSAPSFEQDARSRYYLCTASTLRVRAHDAHADRSQSPASAVSRWPSHGASAPRRLRCHDGQGRWLSPVWRACW
jgi:hypothetical protein